MNPAPFGFRKSEQFRAFTAIAETGTAGQAHPVPESVQQTEDIARISCEWFVEKYAFPGVQKEFRLFPMTVPVGGMDDDAVRSNIPAGAPCRYSLPLSNRFR